MQTAGSAGTQYFNGGIPYFSMQVGFRPVLNDSKSIQPVFVKNNFFPYNFPPTLPGKRDRPPSPLDLPPGVVLIIPDDDFRSIFKTALVFKVPAPAWNSCLEVSRIQPADSAVSSPWNTGIVFKVSTPPCDFDASLPGLLRSTGVRLSEKA
ncbi:Uncharacterised protein [uncultured archaeon]|nr:Uncharacterised protein [uncultured archaeon]